MKKKYLITLSYLFMLFCLVDVSKAADENEYKEIIDDFYIDTASEIPLYSTNGDVEAFYYTGVEDGYVIIDTNGDVIEFSFDTEIEGYNEESSECYYAGPGEYYIEDVSDDSVLIDVNNGKEYNKAEVPEFEYKGESPKKSVTVTLPDGCTGSNGSTKYTGNYTIFTLQETKNLSHNTRYIAYNNNGTCGSTAAAILLYYYYSYINSKYIKDSYYQGASSQRSKDFIKYLQGVIGDDGNGTTYSKLTKGINKYLDSIGLSKNCKYVSKYNILKSPVNIIMSYIDKGKPCIVGTSNEPVYGDHWVVAIGYARYYGINGRTRGNVYFIKVNNGLYSSKEKSIVYVNYNYIDGVIYLE